MSTIVADEGQKRVDVRVHSARFSPCETAGGSCNKYSSCLHFSPSLKCPQNLPYCCVSRPSPPDHREDKEVELIDETREGNTKRRKSVIHGKGRKWLIRKAFVSSHKKFPRNGESKHKKAEKTDKEHDHSNKKYATIKNDRIKKDNLTQNNIKGKPRILKEMYDNNKNTKRKRKIGKNQKKTGGRNYSHSKNKKINKKGNITQSINSVLKKKNKKYADRNAKRKRKTAKIGKKAEEPNNFHAKNKNKKIKRRDFVLKKTNKEKHAGKKVKQKKQTKTRRKKDKEQNIYKRRRVKEKSVRNKPEKVTLKHNPKKNKKMKESKGRFLKKERKREKTEEKKRSQELSGNPINTEKEQRNDNKKGEKKDKAKLKLNELRRRKIKRKHSLKKKTRIKAQRIQKEQDKNKNKEDEERLPSYNQKLVHGKDKTKDRWESQHKWKKCSPKIKKCLNAGGRCKKWGKCKTNVIPKKCGKSKTCECCLKGGKYKCDPLFVFLIIYSHTFPDSTSKPSYIVI